MERSRIKCKETTSMDRVSGPADDDHSAAAESFRAWVALGKPKGGIEKVDCRAKAMRPRYTKAKARLASIDAELEAEELKKRSAKMKKRRIR